MGVRFTIRLPHKALTRKAESTGKYLVVVLKRYFHNVRTWIITDSSFTNWSETQMTDSANLLYIAIVSDTEPQNT